MKSNFRIIDVYVTVYFFGKEFKLEAEYKNLR